MEKQSFNDGLGAKLRAPGEVAKKTSRSLRVMAGAAIALAAAAVALASKYWIGV